MDRRRQIDPGQLDTLRRLDATDLTGGAEDHTTHCRLRSLRKDGLASLVIIEGEPVWGVTEAERGALERRVRWEGPQRHRQLSSGR